MNNFKKKQFINQPTIRMVKAIIKDKNGNIIEEIDENDND